jgi:DNA mismatch repair protein MutS
MVEMSETSNIIRNATRDSLIILDEIGRGTSTYDGLSIAWAVSEYILRPELSAKTLFATHYHELIELAASYGQVQNYSVAVREKGGSIVFLRKIVEGGTDKSYGVHVAKLAGLPQVIIDRANDILQQLETDKSERTNISGFLREQVQEETKPAENPLLDEIRGLDLDNLRPMEALLYIEKWQKELRND